MDEKQSFEANFLQFIFSLYSSCMFQLGKMMNPITGKIEKDFNGARATIEMLKMIEAKTKGNLSQKEEEALKNALSNMQMNYVDEVKKEEENRKKEEKKENSGRNSEEKIMEDI